jgi:hypothetical protein
MADLVPPRPFLIHKLRLIWVRYSCRHTSKCIMVLPPHSYSWRPASSKVSPIFSRSIPTS